VHAGDAVVSNGGAISSSTGGTGNGGDVRVWAKQLTLDGSRAIDGLKTQIAAQSEPAGTGNAGQVSVSVAGRLLITGQASINTSAPNAGGGDEQVGARLLDLQDGGISSAADLAGGNISISPGDRLTLSPQGFISATSEGTSRSDRGGNILIGRTSLAFLRGVGVDAISANANQGNGGNITLQTAVFIRPADTPADAINSSSVGGIAGKITVQSPEVDLTGELVPLISSLNSADVTLVPNCGMQLGLNQSSFTLEGGNGLPSDPANLQPSQPQPTTRPVGR
jgi:hypothetical protein